MHPVGEKKIIYENEVRSIGLLATNFLTEKMIILFGDKAPAELKDYCFTIHDHQPVRGEIYRGQELEIDNQSYGITAVGNLVQKNLNDLGHITLKFDGSVKAEMAGTLYLASQPMPTIKVGTRIIILSQLQQ